MSLKRSVVVSSVYSCPEVVVLELIEDVTIMSLSGQWDDPGTDPRFPGGDE